MLILVQPGLVSANLISFDATVTSFDGDTVTVNCPQFNPALGQLQNVALSGNADMQAYFTFNAVDIGSVSLDSSQFEVEPGGAFSFSGTTWIIRLYEGGQPFNFGPVQIGPIQAAGSYSQTYTTSSPGGLNQFIGEGSDTVSMDEYSGIQSGTFLGVIWGNAPGVDGDGIYNVTAQSTNDSPAGTVTYTYTPNDIPGFNTIVVTASPGAGGTVSGGGIFASGSPDTVTTTVNSGYIFANWTLESNVVSTAINYTLTITNDEVLVANFVGAPTAYPQFVAASENTAIAVTLTGYDPNTPPLPLTYALTTQPTNGTLAGSPPNLTYTPNSGYTGPDSFQFTVNNGYFTSAAAAVSLSVLGSPFTVTVSASPANGGSVSGGGSFPSGSSVTVAATVNSNYVFSYWTENGSMASSSPTYTFTLTNNEALIAYFTSNVIPGAPQPYKAIGEPLCDCDGLTIDSAGDPIRLGNGNLFEKIIDYQTAGAGTLDFTRYYNSLNDSNTAAGTLGPGWRSTFDRYLRITTSGGEPASLIAERPDGQELIFNPNPGGPTWSSDADVDIGLAQVASDWTLTNYDDTVETYTTVNSGLALLISIRARDGYTQTLKYNAANRLESVTDSFGRALQFAYQGNLLQTVMTPNGLVLTYAYNAASALASVTYSTTPQTSQTYLYENGSFPFALTGMIDEDGNRFATWTYDASGRATSSQHAGGANLTTISYNPDGTTTVTNALDQVMVYSFTNNLGVPKVTSIARLASATVPAATMAYAYDANGYLAGSTDWNTNVTSQTNDYRGLPLVVNEAVGTLQARATTNVLLANFHLPLTIGSPRKFTAYAYDTNGNALKWTETDAGTGAVPYSTSGQTRTWTFTYDSLGHVLTAIGPRTDVTATTSFTYDTNGNLSTVTDALGHITQFTNYNGSGEPLTMVDPNGVITSFLYDARDRLLSYTVQVASGYATTSLGYDLAGQVTLITLPDGSGLGFQYDAAHRLQSVTNSLGESIVYSHDAEGDIIQQSVASTARTIVRTERGVFDQLGRMLQQVGAYSETTTYGYDSDGNRTSIADGLTNTTLRAFDALNRLVASVDPLNNSTGYGYDPQDNLVSVADPRALVTSYVYNGFQEVIQQTSPDQGATVYVLDQAGNRISQTDARGVVTLRTFDQLNRVISETFPASPGENITYSYDDTSGGNFGIGRLTGYADETGGTSLTYNERGDFSRTTRVIGGQTYITTYTYDLADHVLSITYPSGDAVTYARDSQGRINAVSWLASGSTTPVSLATNVTYLPFGPVSGFVYGNGLVRSQNYDQDYRLIGISTSSSGANIQSLSLGYDAVNDITSITDALAASRNQAFAYDPDYRLIQATGLYGLINYAYDPDGNRFTQVVGGVTESYNYSLTANSLLSTVKSVITRNFTYTPNGNLAGDDRGTATNLVFNYGNRNRYDSLYLGTSAVAAYQYNAPGERLVKTVGGTTTHFHYDEQGRLLAESQANGTPIREYVWLDDIPLAQIENGGVVYYIHPDHLNTPQKLTDASQAVVWDRLARPFGETTAIAYPASSPPLASLSYNAQQGFQFTVLGDSNYNYTVEAAGSLNAPNWEPLATKVGIFTFDDVNAANYPSRFYRLSSTAPVVTENLRFPGQYYDAESGLNYNLIRDYDPSLGRYIQCDPIGLASGVNLNEYVMNNPICLTDPLGLIWQYSQSSGKMVHIDDSTGKQTIVGKGYAGQNGGLNNPANQSVQGTDDDSDGGPLPQGGYTIGPQQLNITSSGTKLPRSMRLIPDPDNQMYGRSGFLIHGDNSDGDQSASRGCIILKPNVRNKIGKSSDKRLVVVP